MTIIMFSATAIMLAIAAALHEGYVWLAMLFAFVYVGMYLLAIVCESGILSRIARLEKKVGELEAGEIERVLKDGEDNV